MLEPSSLDDDVAQLGYLSLAAVGGEARGHYVVGDPERDSVLIVGPSDEGVASVRVVNGFEVLGGQRCRDCAGIGFGRGVATTAEGLIVVGGGTRSRATGFRDAGGVWLFHVDGDDARLIAYKSVAEMGLGNPWGTAEEHLRFASVSVEQGKGGRVFFGVSNGPDPARAPGGVVEGILTDAGLRFVRAWSAEELGLGGYLGVGQEILARTHDNDGTLGLFLKVFGEDRVRHIAYVVLSDGSPEFRGVLPRPTDVMYLGNPCRISDVTGDGVGDVLVGACRLPRRKTLNFDEEVGPRECFISVYDVSGEVPQLVKTVPFDSFVDGAGARLPVHRAPKLAMDDDQTHLLFSAGDRHHVYVRSEERSMSGLGAVWRVPLDVFNVD